jgi:dTDP-glucose 4,6-dehydratase
MRQRVLVTGGCGFLGSHFVRAWLLQGRGPVCNIDLLTYAGSTRRVGDLSDHAGYHFHRCDVTDAEGIRDILREFGPEVVVHFAAESHVTRSELAPTRFWRTNVDGTQNMLHAAEQARVRRFLHVSTDEVYGPVLAGLYREHDKPEGVGRATSPYAQSKALADDIALAFRGSMEVVVVRPTNCFGPWQHPEKAFARWVTRALTGRRLPVWGDGLYVRQWISAGALVRALLAILDAQPPFSVFNVGPRYSAEVTNLTLARWLIGYLGLPEERITLTRYDRPGHDRRYGIDPGRIESLGWTPGDLWAQLAETVEWYRASAWWWEPLISEAETIYTDAVPARHSQTAHA